MNAFPVAWGLLLNVCFIYRLSWYWRGQGGAATGRADCLKSALSISHLCEAKKETSALSDVLPHGWPVAFYKPDLNVNVSLAEFLAGTGSMTYLHCSFYSLATYCVESSSFRELIAAVLEYVNKTNKFLYSWAEDKNSARILPEFYWSLAGYTVGSGFLCGMNKACTIVTDLLNNNSLNFLQQ